MKTALEQIEQIQTLVSQRTGVSIADILSPSRKSNIVFARHISMHLCRWFTNANLLFIAKSHGRDYHATVIHACKVIDWEARHNDNLNSILDQLETEIKSIK
jgi:chromosomal replication initiator protein